jgi:HSP20 family protein
MTRNPFDELERVFDRMTQQFEELEGEVFETSVRVDVRDAGDAYVVTADVPGFEQEDIDVELAGNRLTIAAARTAESGDETEEETAESRAQGRYIRRERRRDSVSRTVRLPEDVDEENTTAEYDKGVLTVTLSKQNEESGRSIPID